LVSHRDWKNLLEHLRADQLPRLSEKDFLPVLFSDDKVYEFQLSYLQEWYEDSLQKQKQLIQQQVRPIGEIFGDSFVTNHLFRPQIIEMNQAFLNHIERVTKAASVRSSNPPQRHLSPTQVHNLNQWISTHRQYPSFKMKVQLAFENNMTPTQIQDWFNNHKRRKSINQKETVQ